MHQGQKFQHKTTSETGTIYGRVDSQGRVHCLMDDGEFRWLRVCDLTLTYLRQAEPTPEEAANATGKSPQELLRVSRMSGLTLRQVVEALR